MGLFRVLVLSVAAVLAAAAADNPIRVRLVTGGHEHEPSFYVVFDSMSGVDTTVRPHPDAFTGDLLNSTDVLVLYDMVQAVPPDQKRALQQFAESGKGVVVLHHAIADYQDWPWFAELAGGKYFLQQEGSHAPSTYKHGVALRIEPVGQHPVTAGLGSFDIVDECYKGMAISPQSKILLRTADPLSDGPVAWISPWSKSRVVYIQLGHGRASHENPAYRRLVRNAIFWAAGR